MDGSEDWRRAAPGRGRWCDALAARFLLELALTGNVRAAARAAGYTTPTLYWRRQRHPVFACAWALALAEGQARAKIAYYHKRIHREEIEAIPDIELRPDQAMHQLRLHRYSQRGGKPQRYDHSAKPLDIAEARKIVLRVIDAVKTLEAWGDVLGIEA